MNEETLKTGSKKSEKENTLWMSEKEEGMKCAMWWHWKNFFNLQSSSFRTFQPKNSKVHTNTGRERFTPTEYIYAKLNRI